MINCALKELTLRVSARIILAALFFPSFEAVVNVRSSRCDLGLQITLRWPAGSFPSVIGKSKSGHRGDIFPRQPDVWGDTAVDGYMTCKMLHHFPANRVTLTTQKSLTQIFLLDNPACTGVSSDRHSAPLLVSRHREIIWVTRISGSKSSVLSMSHHWWQCTQVVICGFLFKQACALKVLNPGLE